MKKLESNVYNFLIHSSKSVLFTKLAVSFLLAKFACANLAAKFSPINLLTVFQPGEGELFGPPAFSTRHNFFLVIAMKLKFSTASQPLIRKILQKYF